MDYRFIKLWTGCMYVGKISMRHYLCRCFQEFCDQWSCHPALPEMDLPPPSPYIATDFEVKGGANGAGAEERAALAKSLGLPTVLTTPPDLIVDRPGMAG